MRQFARYAVFSTILFGSIAAQAQGPKVAVIEFERAVFESNEGLRINDVLKAKVEEKKKMLEAKKKDIDTATEALKGKSALMNDAAKAAAAREIDAKAKELERLNDEAQRELDEMRKRLFEPIAEIAAIQVKSMAAEKGVVLFDITENSLFVYTSPKINLTEELKKRINSEFKAPAADAKPSK